MQKIIDEYISARYFFPDIDEYFKRKNIVDADNKIKIAIEKEIEKIEKSKEKISSLIDNKKYFHLQSERFDIYYHPCTDGKNKYQISFFTDGIPISDIRRDNLKDIKEELINYHRYNIVEIL